MHLHVKHVPTVKLWLMVLNLYLVLLEGHTNWQEPVWMLPTTEGYWSSNHVFRATNLPLQIVGLKIKAIMCNIRFCIAGEMAIQFF